ncbi:nucleoside diphosphate kinase regulator [Alkalilimnicola ehrlichii]|uniref:Nucleoside diphosphate kinase regulator n=1 Tax=Alkalilimnicola ehrlichii TaxID=351052 RepID=A0A3E0WL65_9GAMM|nr:nucleoside diphosphate kinase regulator [Alkalilimnicola ehrlichii]RFA26555.1 nucleoside diphosphate kinase regulator [Alkalilimnicola ehrlichii]RFA32943.1 nucleoside diphosphate kinase regulator [Alkalilimnicola ehrlichii]
MAELPNITVSSLDLERIEALLDELPPNAAAQLKGLEEELERAEVLEPEEIPPTLVTMNSTVRFVEEESGKEFELTLCYPHAVDGKPGKVSILAPVGSALLGLSVGQVIDWPRPDGRSIRVRVVDLMYQPERAGDYNR